MKYKIGDKVRIVDKRTNLMSPYGEMDKYLGSIMTITNINTTSHSVSMREDEGLFVWYPNMIQERVGRAELEIYITKKNNTTIAVLKEGDKVIKKAVAKCCPEDEYDFDVGAKLAMKRLYCENKEIDWSKKSDFKPHLNLKSSKPFDRNEHYGEIGEPTNLIALFGEKLYVGDIVEFFCTYDSSKTKQYVTKHNNNYGVMGLYGTNIKCGITDGFQIKKIKSYKDLQNNEKAGIIIAILKED